MIHISGTKVPITSFLVALLTVYDIIQWCSPPLTGVIAGECEAKCVWFAIHKVIFFWAIGGI